MTDPPPDDLVEAIRSAEHDFHAVPPEAEAVLASEQERRAEAKARSGRAIAALYRQVKSWPEVARLTGLPRTTLLRRAQPYL